MADEELGTRRGGGHIGGGYGGVVSEGKKMMTSVELIFDRLCLRLGL